MIWNNKNEHIIRSSYSYFTHKARLKAGLLGFFVFSFTKYIMVKALILHQMSLFCFMQCEHTVSPPAVQSSCTVLCTSKLYDNQLHELENASVACSVHLV